MNAKNKSKNKKIAVLYHGNCFDGFGGAWAAWKHFGNNASYIPLSRQEEPPFHLKGKTLYFVDFVYSQQIMKKFMAQNVRVTAIDHHVSGEAATKTTQKPLYALHHSGAVLAWSYFHGKKSTPQLLRYIEDQDLWRFKIKGTAEVSTVLSLRDLDFRVWDVFAKALENRAKRAAILHEGTLLLEYRRRMVARLLKDAELVRFGKRVIYALNSSSEFASDAGNLLAKKRPPFAIVWNHSRGGVRASLRGDGSVNVSKIAEKFGGGGHNGAAGFLVKSEKDLPWKYVRGKK